MPHPLLPKLFTTLREYSREQLIKDVIAGVIVGIIAIPLSIALGISSFPEGVSPNGFTPAESGLYTAIIAGFLISLLGGSRVQIGGPTGAFVVIVYGILLKYGYDGLVVATLMAGVFLAIMGLCRMGSMIKYIPYPITAGFTCGIAVVLFLNQIKSFLGLSFTHVVDGVTKPFSPDGSVETVEAIFRHIGTLDPVTLIVGALALLIIIAWPKLPWRFAQIIPGALIAIIATTLLVKYAELGTVRTIGTLYPDLKAQMPHFKAPSVSWEVMRALTPAAITIALLAAIESLLSAVVADGMIGARHRSNAELVAQGAANIGAALFGGIPATGAIARTAANVRNGGRTPVAGLVHALSVLLIMLLLMTYAKLIPMTTLAAILIIVCYNMGDWQAFRDIAKAPKSDLVVLLITFTLTVAIDLVAAIEVGMVIACLLFMKRMAAVTEVKLLSDDEGGMDTIEDKEIRRKLAKNYKNLIVLYEINGPFFFGAADKFMEVSGQVDADLKAIIIKMEHVPAVDATALHFLETLQTTCHKRGIFLYLTHVHSQPMRALERAEFAKDQPKTLILPTIEEAVEHFETTRL